MIWAIVITFMGFPTIVLVAWAMWLCFAALMAKWHGIEGLKAAAAVGRGFRPLEWASLGRATRRQARSHSDFLPDKRKPTSRG
jgi:hypothetical protein